MSVSLEERGDPSVSNHTQPVTASAVFDLLSNTRRRCVIHFLLEQPETTVRELSRHVAAWENDVELSAVSSRQRKRVYTGLHQTHLPRLNEYGILEYDQNRGDIRATERLEVFAPYFGPTEDEQRQWHRYYLGVGAGIVAYSLAGLLGVPGIAAVPPVAVALVAGSLVVAVAVVHARADDEGGDLPTYPDLQPTRAAEEAPAGD